MTTITHPALVAALVKPPQDIIATLNTFTVDLWHGATGVSGEAGELLEALLFPPAEGFDRVNLREELGDIYFYMEQIVQRSGIVIDWDSVYLQARNAELTHDLIVHYGACVAVHASQVLDAVKKAALYNKALDLEVLTNSMNALAVGLVTLGYMFGIDQQEALQANISKLSKRYASLAYSDQQAQDRADKVQPQEGVIPARKPFKGEPLDLPSETKDVCERPYNAAEAESTDPYVVGDLDQFTPETALQFYRDYGRPPAGWLIDNTTTGQEIAIPSN